MKRMLVIGAGRFGRQLALGLTDLGSEVTIIDKDEAKVEALAPYVAAARVADMQREEAVRSLDVHNYNCCFVCVSGDFQSSLEITALLKSMDAKQVVSKTDSEMQGDFLEKIGANEIVHAEKETANRLAAKYGVKNVFDYAVLSQDYAIAETLVPREWLGHSVHELATKTRYNVNLVGYKGKDKQLVPHIGADHVFHEDEHILVAGFRRDIAEIASRNY